MISMDDHCLFQGMYISDVSYSILQMQLRRLATKGETAFLTQEPDDGTKT